MWQRTSAIAVLQAVGLEPAAVAAVPVPLQLRSQRPRQPLHQNEQHQWMDARWQPPVLAVAVGAAVGAALGAAVAYYGVVRRRSGKHVGLASRGPSNGCRRTAVRQGPASVAGAAGPPPPLTAAAVPADYYTLLGLPRFDAERDQIRSAYRRVVKLVHPDVLGGDTTELTTLVTEAYHTLNDEVRKAQYDEALRGTGGGDGGPGGLSSLANWMQGRFASPTAKRQWEENLELSKKRHSVWDSSAPAASQAVFVDETQCVVCYNCVECAPNTFEMDTEFSGRAHVVRQYGDSDADVEWAVQSCPTSAISFVDRDDLPLLEEMMPLLEIESPDKMLKRRMYGNSWANTPPIGPHDMLDQFRSSAQDSTNWGPNGQKHQSAAKAVEQLAVSIKKAVASVPGDVRMRVWPGLSPTVGTSIGRSSATGHAVAQVGTDAVP